MATQLIARKLRIKEGFTLLTLNAPAQFTKGLVPLPAGVTVTDSGKDYDQVHWFVHNRAGLEKQLPRVLKLLKEDIIIWIYYPKGSSGMQTDLTRDKGWDSLMKEDSRLAWLSLVSFDDTWSVFGFRAITDDDRKKAAKPAVREIFQWVDPVAKSVRLPDDLSAAFRKNKEAAGFFETLSFTNKKEYLEWIVTAKREETRAQRVADTMERLGKGWKNPANR